MDDSPPGDSIPGDQATQSLVLQDTELHEPHDADASPAASSQSGLLAAAPPHTAGSTPSMESLMRATGPRLTISEERRRSLSDSSPGIPTLGPKFTHIMHYIIRVLKSWPRLMAVHGLSQLPPFIHTLQLTERIPTPLVDCLTLVKMWADYTEASASLVQRTVLQEHSSYTASGDILAAAQALLILLIILFFGFRDDQVIDHSSGAQLLIDVWEVKQNLAATGLFLEAEIDHRLPSWKDWAIVSAKRRTILNLHHLEYSWSLLHGYPPLTCLELGPFPAPTARYLWHQTDEATWITNYMQWLRLWKDGVYRTAELFHVKRGEPLDERGELWLAETDELGVMLMAEVNAVAGVDE
ncbi:putative Transcription factor domain-containing protein [Seiridium cardinale]